ATDEEVIGLMNQLLPFIQELDDQGDAPTTFEIITVMAFCYFVHKVDIAVIETGMGGRFDTTNCFVPEVSVITNISMDHMQFLGASLPEIAWHKAGIIKDHVPVVLGNIEDPNSIEVFEKESKANQAEIYRLGHEFCYKREANNVSWWWANEQAPSRFSINMKGKHQADNAAVAQMVLRLLHEQGMNLKEEAVQRGLASSVLPGRFEIIHSQPVIVLDSAHNVAGMEAFLATLSQEFPGYRKVLLFAGFKDKQLQEMLQVTEKYVDEVVLTTFDHPRAASVRTLEEIAQHIPRKVVLDWKKTVTSMMAEEKTGNTVFCITGSLHFITEIRRFIQNEKSQKL